MSSLDVARTELALAVLYLNKAEARDKICRAIQYGSKFLSNGEPGTAQNVDKSTSLARKVFRLFKVNSSTVFILQDAAVTFLRGTVGSALTSERLHFFFVVTRFLYLIMFQFINDLHGLISPTAPGTPLPLVLLGKVITRINSYIFYLILAGILLTSSRFLLQSKNALLSTFLFLDQIVWLGRTGVYKVHL